MKEKASELVAICFSVAWFIYRALLLSNRIVKEMVFLQAKDGFSTSCQLLQFLQRASLGKTLNPATESSSSSLNFHIEVEFHIYRLSVVLRGTASWLWVKVLPSPVDCFVVEADHGSYLKVPGRVPYISVGWNLFIFSTNYMGQYSNLSITGFSPSWELPKFYFALVYIFLS